MRSIQSYNIQIVRSNCLLPFFIINVYKVIMLKEEMTSLNLHRYSSVSMELQLSYFVKIRNYEVVIPYDLSSANKYQLFK